MRDEKAHTFSWISKNEKNGQKRILCKFAFIAATLVSVGAIYYNFFNLVFKLFKFKPLVIDNIYSAFFMCTFQRSWCRCVRIDGTCQKFPILRKNRASFGTA